MNNDNYLLILQRHVPVSAFLIAILNEKLNLRRRAGDEAPPYELTLLILILRGYANGTQIGLLSTIHYIY